MFKLALRSLIDKKIRFALTTLVVVIGVMFVVASFSLTDSLRSTFSGLAEDIAEGADLTVRVRQEIGSDFDSPTMPESVATDIAGVAGVAEVSPDVAGLNVVIIDGEGNAIRPPGPPALGFNFNPAQFFITEGRPPQAAGEFAADNDTAADNGLAVGETYEINGPIASERFELVGLFNFGDPDTNTGLGQTMSAFELDEAQRFLGFDDEYLAVGVVVAPDAEVAAVQARLEAELDDSYEVISQEAVAAEQEADFNEAIDIFSIILLVFAFIAVFVSAFIINNTFQIILGQRIREIGLWRAIGATTQQVSRSILIESAIVGVLSTVIGIGLGLALASVLRSLLDLAGFALPPGPLELRPRSIALAILVGLGVTMASSISPAMRARRISPVAALSHDSRIAGAGLRRRLIVGGIMGVIGVTTLAVGMTAGLETVATFSLLGPGALLSFVAINIVSPAFARPAATILGRPVRGLFGVAGRLGSDNAARNPRRTASTAGALMIGLALMGLASVVGESIKKSFVNIIENAVEADYFIQSEGGGFDPTVGFPASLADDIEALPEIESVVRVQFAEEGVTVGDNAKDIVAVDMAIAESHFDGKVTSGDIGAGDPLTSVALHTDSAEDLDVAVGDTLEMSFPDNETDVLTVVAIFDDAAIYGNWLIDVQLWGRHFNRSDLLFASARVAGLSDGLSADERSALFELSGTAIDDVLERYPTAKAENRAEFRESQESQLTTFVRVIQVLLGLSFVIALIGIVNTLSLSVFQRTREIGLLRSVGMTRRQLRRSIYWESIIVAVFGGLLGVVVGTVFGSAAALALPDSIVQDLAIPWLDLVIFVVASALAGLAAAALPAWRAGRMNILDAIAHE